MNGMTSTKRIFALLDTPEPAHGTATLPATAGTDAGTDAGTKAGAKADGGITVSFDHVGYSYDDAGTAIPSPHPQRPISKAKPAPIPPPAPALTNLTFTAYGPVNSPPSSASPVPANPRLPRCSPVR